MTAATEPAPAAPTCDYHHRTPATATCVACDKPVCDVCTTTVNSRAFCTGCGVGRATQLGWLAAVFGLLLPGAGQAYNGQFGKAVVVLVTSPIVIPWLWGVYDAASTAEQIALGRVESSTVPTGGVLIALKILWLPVAAIYGTLLTLILAGVGALLAGGS